MRKLYIDTTQLVHWEGFVAGIPRVMYELSRRFTDTELSSVVYVSWVKEVGAYCEIDFFATMDDRSGGIRYRHQTTGINDNKTVEVQRSIVKYTKKIAKKIIQKTGMIEHRYIKKLQAHAAHQAASVYRQVTFAKGDVVFIPWGEWWDENFIAMLEREHKDASIQIIPLIHDVLPFTQTPHFSGHSTDSLREYCRRIMPISQLILTVSRSTRDDLAGWMKRQKLTIPRIEVFRLGEDFSFATAIEPDDPLLLKNNIKGNDYILCVGTVEAKKNHTLLYYVYKLAYTRGIILPKLIIVGREGWKTENIRDFIQEDPETKDDILMLHSVSDEQLSWLYDHALISVFPSFAEGWGMPIAESIARGVPCVCSDTTSMVEIAEEYVRHFNPASTDECLAAIQKTLQPRELASMKKKCRKYRQTTWDESFLRVRSLIKEVAYV
jgi:glycosyltransferase involved in cell wall biosynthesis